MHRARQLRRGMAGAKRHGCLPRREGGLSGKISISDRPYEREFERHPEVRTEFRARTRARWTCLHVGRNDPAGYFYYVMELADDAQDKTRSPEIRKPERNGRNFRMTNFE